MDDSYTIGPFPAGEIRARSQVKARELLLKCSRRNLIFCMIFIIVIPFTLYANLKTVAKEVRRFKESYRPEEADYESRLREVRKMLPKEGIVGYVTDEAMDPLEKTRYFHLTQYGLCPLIVVSGKKHPFVVAYSRGFQHPAEPLLQGLVLVRDFDDGIRLYRNDGK
jgi:hypothetical protein